VWETEQEALGSPTGDLRMAFCRGCGLIGNQAHDPAKVSFRGYDVSTDHSPQFQEFIQSLARRLIERYSLHGKRVIDIGCGRGYFLKTICRLGGNEGLGIDPSGVASHDPGGADAGIRYDHDVYGPKHSGERADLVSCRQVLDILGDQKGFLSLVRRALDSSPNTVVYFEVPHGLHTFGERVIWNLVYEHRNWYCEESLAALFRICGFEVLEVAPCWRGEYLGIEARASASPPTPALLPTVRREQIEGTLAGFSASTVATRDQWHRKIQDLQNQGRRVALWGAGARAVSFLTAFDVRTLIPMVVDINPKRCGRFLPRSAHRVESPEVLRQYRPDLIVISNPTYELEIRAHADQLGLAAEFWVL